MDTISFEQPSRENNGEDFEYLSKDGFERLKEELTHARTVKRQEIAKRLEYAKSLGDLSENAEYNEAKIMQEENEGRIAELEDILRRTVLITRTSPNSVEIGSVITVERIGEKGIARYTIVGSEEADPLGAKISNESPLGKAFLGRKKGDKVVVVTPGGTAHFKIIDIS